jgi:hypothetical protein
MSGVWLAVFLPAVLIAVALGLECLERHLSGPPHRDPKRKASDNSADVLRSVPGKQVRTVRMPSRLAVAVTSGVVLLAGVTALILGRSAPTPIPIPLFTGAPPAAVVPAPPVVDDIIAPAPVPATAQQAARPAAVANAVMPPSGTTTRTTSRPTAEPRAVLTARASASDKVRDGAGPSASSSSKSQAKQSHGGGSGTSPKKANAKGKKSKSSHGNKGGRKG